MSDRQIPEGLKVLRKTPTFDLENVPQALLNKHVAPNWGLLKIEAGNVVFVEPPNDMHEQDLTVSIHSGESCVIVPGYEHFVELSSDAKFHIEFYG